MHPFLKRVRAYLKKNYGKVLLIYILLYLIFAPIAEHFPISYNAVLVQYLILSLFGPYLITSKRYIFIVSCVFVGFMAIVVFETDQSSLSKFYYFSASSAALLNFFIIGILFWYILHFKQFSADAIFASICVYLLIAIAFGNLYSLIEHLAPKSFYFASKSAYDLNLLREDFVYFSFTTLTTLGYGDIVPLTPIAKRIASIEAAFGILYIAHFVGMIIGFMPKRSLKSP